jgi:hypothetical protein
MAATPGSAGVSRGRDPEVARKFMEVYAAAAQA